MPRKGKRKKIASPKKKAGPSSIRLNRLLAAAGFGSRRQCDELIQEGRVEIDGEIVVKLATTVSNDSKVYVDGSLLKKQRLVYYAVNKPVGVVTTNRDPQGRPRVIDLVPNTERVFAVGRLDRNSEGLILLTNDGELAQQLAHPKFGVKKIYRVTVAGKVDGETMKQMRRGIYISDGHVKVEGAKVLKSRSRSTELEITLREGKNREIRRILARLGNKVQHLRRIAIGPLRLGDMPAGAHRRLTSTEIKKLREQSSTELTVDDTQSKPKQQKTSKKRSGPKKKIGVAKPKQRIQPQLESDFAADDDPNMSVFDVGLESPTKPGAVIGADASDEEPPRPRRSSTGRKKSATKKRSTARGGAKKKRVTKKSGTKKRTTKKKKSSKKPTSKPRRGAGRTPKPKTRKTSKKGRRR